MYRLRFGGRPKPVEVDLNGRLQEASGCGSEYSRDQIQYHRAMEQDTAMLRLPDPDGVVPDPCPLEPSLPKGSFPVGEGPNG